MSSIINVMIKAVWVTLTGFLPEFWRKPINGDAGRRLTTFLKDKESCSKSGKHVSWHDQDKIPDRAACRKNAFSSFEDVATWRFFSDKMLFYQDFFFLDVVASTLVSYFFLNLSTRPAVSTIFCLPVIKGWQLEQISVLMSFLVDLVWITLPQTQVIVVSW